MLAVIVGYRSKADVTTTLGLIQHVCSRGDHLCAGLSDARQVLLVAWNHQV